MKGYNNWMNIHSGNIDESDLQQIWNATDSYKGGYSPDVEKGHNLLMAKIHSDKNIRAKTTTLTPIRKLFRIAAVIAVLVVAGMYLSQFQDAASEINFEMVEAADKIKHLDLQDGTLVTLNTNTSLTYPNRFENDSRRVRLRGEAFFDVKRDEGKPFKIETDRAMIEVLGTSFNVRSFPDENSLEVYVKSGSVAVSVIDEDEVHVLSEEELLNVDFSENKTMKRSEDSGNSLAWNTGKLTFINKPMGEIFEALEKLHHIKFELKEENLKTCRHTVNFGATDMKDIIRGLEAACDLTFSQKNSVTYEVSGSCCD